MRIVRYFSLLVLIANSLNAIGDQHQAVNGMQSRQERKVAPKLNGQSIIPVAQEDMHEAPLFLASAGHKGGHEGGHPGEARANGQTRKIEHSQEAKNEEHKGNGEAKHLADSAKSADAHAAQQAAPKAGVPTAPKEASIQPAPTPVAQPQPAPQTTPQVVQPMPQAPVPQPAVAPPAQEEEIKGIDTVDIDEPQGNWLLKRIWWQRGQAQYEKIKALVEAIMETRMAFFAKRTEWDKKIFDPFYLEVGLGRGVLEELISNLMQRIENERAKAGQLNPEERAFLDSLEAEKNTLDQLQKDIQLINDIDGRTDDMITLLIQQINKARSYENQSWQNLKAIAQELNDKRARELFYTMSTNWQNVNDISSFIQGQFFQSFDQLGKQAQEQIAKVKSTIQTLKEKGIDLKKQWQDIEDRSKVDKDKERLDQERIAEELAFQKKKEEEAKRGFFGKLWNQAVKTVNGVYGLIKSGFSSLWNNTIGRFFTKKAKPVEADADQATDQKQDGENQTTTTAPSNDKQAPQASAPISDQSEQSSSALPMPVPMQQPVQL